MKYICKICGQIIDNDSICPYCGSDSSHIEPYSSEHKRYRCLNCGHEIDNSNECPFCGATGNLIFNISPDVTEDDNLEQEITEETPKKDKPVFEFCEGDDCCCEDEDFDDEESLEEHEECCCHHEDNSNDHQCCHHDENEEHCCCKNHDGEPNDLKFTADSFLANHEEENSESEHECHHCGHCQNHTEEHTEEHHECSCCDEEDTSDFEDLITSLLTVYGHLYVTDLNKANAFKEYLMNFLREVAFDFDHCYDVESAFENLENNIYFKDIIKQFKD